MHPGSSRPSFRSGSRPIFLTLTASFAIEFMRKRNRCGLITFCQRNDNGHDQQHRSRSATLKQLKNTPIHKWKHSLAGVPVNMPNGGTVTSPTTGRLLGHVRVWKDVKWMDSSGNGDEECVQIEFERLPGDEIGSRPHENNDSDATASAPSSHGNEDAHDIHFIQFIRRQKWDLSGKQIRNLNFNLHDQLWHRRGEWFLDVPRCAVASGSPYYDAYGMHNRRCGDGATGENSLPLLSIFDRPCGIFHPEKHSKLSIELETYLVVRGAIVWRIHWEYVQTRTQKGFTNIRGGPARTIIPDIIENSDDGVWKVGYSHPQSCDLEHTLSLTVLWK